MMSSQPQPPTNRQVVRPRPPQGEAGNRSVRLDAALGHQPAGFWVAALAAVGVIIGGIGPWASWLNFVSISGTSVHGWREVGVGAVALAMLGVHRLRGGRLPLIAACIVGALGLAGAIISINDVQSKGAVTVLGTQYRYLNVAWGLYVVLVGTIVLVLSTAALAWRGNR
jgi:hypothetical protein